MMNYNNILDNYSFLNRLQVIGGKRNSCFIETEKYNITRKELCNLFIKHITTKDIISIKKHLELDSDESAIKECFSLINKATSTGEVDYKDLFMERILLDSCYSAIVLLKRLFDRKHEKKEEITLHQLEMIEYLISIKNKIPKRDRDYIYHLWCYRSSKKLVKREAIRLMKIYNKSKRKQ